MNENSSDKQEREGGEVFVMDPGSRSEIHHSLLKVVACSYKLSLLNVFPVDGLLKVTDGHTFTFLLVEFQSFIFLFQTRGDTSCG